MQTNFALICAPYVCFFVIRMTPLVSRRAIFDIWSGNNQIERCNAVYEFILGQFGGVTSPDDVIKILKTSSRSLRQQIELKWNKCYRHRGRFLKNYSDWLAENISFPSEICQYFPSTSTDQPSSKPGRTSKSFEECHVILETISCGFSINANAFENYADETRHLYLKEYGWFYMPSSVHKILYHGKLVIASCILPIGQRSEEAQEARNKDNRRYREYFTRKTLRIDTNIDLINRL